MEEVEWQDKEKEGGLQLDQMRDACLCLSDLKSQPTGWVSSYPFQREIWVKSDGPSVKAQLSHSAAVKDSCFFSQSFHFSYHKTG